MNGTIDKVILNSAKNNKDLVVALVHRELDERAKMVIDVKKIEIASQIYDKKQK